MRCNFWQSLKKFCTWGWERATLNFREQHFILAHKCYQSNQCLHAHFFVYKHHLLRGIGGSEDKNTENLGVKEPKYAWETVWKTLKVLLFIRIHSGLAFPRSFHPVFLFLFLRGFPWSVSCAFSVSFAVCFIVLFLICLSHVLHAYTCLFLLPVA